MISKFHYTVLCTLATSTSLFLAQPGQATEPPDAARLVRELGSDVFREREKAEAELLRLGEAALPALEQGLKSDDLEIRSRCERLTSKIRISIRREAEKNRFREFVRKGLQFGGKLTPNWERFQKLIDSDPKARALFIELHEYDAVFLKLAVENPERVPAWASTRRNELTDKARRLEQSGQNPALIWPEVRMMVKQALALPNPDLNLLDETYRFGRLSGCENDPAIMDMFRLRLSEQLALLAKQGTIDKSVISRLRLRAKDLGMEKELLYSVRPVAEAVIERILNGLNDKKAQTEADGLFEFAFWYEVKGIAPMALKVGLSTEFDIQTRRMAVYFVGMYGTRKQIEPLNQLLLTGR